MSITSKDKAEFYFHMARHTKATPTQCERLLRYAATLQRLATEQCNRVWTEQDEAKRERIQRQVWAVCCDIGTPSMHNVGQYERCENCGATNINPGLHCSSVRPVFSNDPRGACLKIAVPDGFYTDWGKEGIVCPA